MKEKLLTKCENTVFADEIVGLLFDKGIPARLHDESMDTVVGAYGAVTGIAIFVAAADYDRALTLVQPILEARNQVAPMCPKCGSEHVLFIKKKRDWGTFIAIGSLLLLVLPIVYFAWPDVLGHRSEIGDLIAVGMVAAGFLLLFLGRHSTANYRCQDCGHRFYHFKSN